MNYLISYSLGFLSAIAVILFVMRLNVFLKKIDLLVEETVKKELEGKNYD